MNIVFTTTKAGTRLHKEGCRYAKTGQEVVDLTMFGSAKPATCCRPKPEQLAAAASALNAKIFPKEEFGGIEARAPRRELSTARVAEAEPKVPAVAEAPKPKASKKAEPKAPKQTKIIASKGLLESGQQVPAGTRWIRQNRLGALVATVNLQQANPEEVGTSFDGDAKWGAVCVTHRTVVCHGTHRDAWKTLAKSDAWCEGCKSGK